jgi:hypothetical protein|tara:strand:- start:403 stop:579 length:177 start_codon:yes stop_codon:yes gene_type:complete
MDVRREIINAGGLVPEAEEGTQDERKESAGVFGLTFYEKGLLRLRDLKGALARSPVSS